jgi:plastocyanin
MREPTRGIRGGVFVVVVASALLLSACSGGSSGSGARASGGGSVPTQTQTQTVTISNFMFSPMAASVAAGSTVDVTNKDAVTHTLTATGGQFNTGPIDPGQTKKFTAPTKPGTYHYICNIHQYMTGTIVVR